MIRVIQHTSARSYECTIAALEMVVERRADVLCLQERPRERGGIGIRHSAYEMTNRKRVWTAIRRGSGLVDDEPTDGSGGANDDVIATDASMRGERITRIINVYDHQNSHSGERPV